MRRGGARAHQGGELVVLIADVRVVGRVVPEFRVFIVGQNPRAAGIHPFCDNGQTRPQIGSVQCAISDDLIDFMAQSIRIEFCLQIGKPPKWSSECPRRQAQVEVLDFRSRVTERQRAGNNGAGGRATDQIEPIAQTNRLDVLPMIRLGSRLFVRLLCPKLMLLFGNDLLDTFEKGYRNSAAYPAAIEREQLFWTLTEQMSIAIRTAINTNLWAIGSLIHRRGSRSNPHLTPTKQRVGMARVEWCRRRRAPLQCGPKLPRLTVINAVRPHVASERHAVRHVEEARDRGDVPDIAI